MQIDPDELGYYEDKIETLTKEIEDLGYTFRNGKSYPKF
jgi:hypothetical protein